jgi:hypothetical protein
VLGPSIHEKGVFMKVLGKFKRLIPVLCLAATGLAAGGLCAAEAGAGWMFMQVAASGHFDEDTLTLTGVPKTIAFTVRPERKVEQISNSDLRCSGARAETALRPTRPTPR